MADTRQTPDEYRSRLRQKDEEISELRAKLEKLEVVKQITVQTNDLLDRERHKSMVVARVGEIGACVSNCEAMAARLLELIGSHVDYDVGALLLARDDDRRVFVHVNGVATRRCLDEFEESVLGAYAAQTGTRLSRALFLEEVVSGEVAPAEAGGCIQSFCAFPLSIGDDVLGVMAIGSSKAGGFPKRGMDSFELIVNQATLMVDDAARHEALRRSQKKIEALHYMARALESCDSEDAVHKLTIGAARDLLPFAECELGTVRRDRLPDRAGPAAASRGAESEGSMEGEGIVGEAYRSGGTVLTGGEGGGRGEHVCVGSASELASPMSEFGVFHAVSRESTGFRPEDVKLLELLLGYSAEAIRRIRLTDELREQAIHDPLTGVYNRRHFTDAIQRERERARRHSRAIGFLMIDINRFKEINDTRGHQTGDDVLREVADLLRRETRASDMVVRYGGDEFLIVLTEAEGSAGVVRQRIATAFARWGDVDGPFDFPISVAIGEAAWDPAGNESIEAVLSEADRRMYEDKRDSSRRQDPPRSAVAGR